MHNPSLSQLQTRIRNIDQIQKQKKAAGSGLEFDIPFRELGFEGVPFRSTVTVLPSVHCMIELTEMPFLVCPLEEVRFGRGFVLLLAALSLLRPPPPWLARRNGRRVPPFFPPCASPQPKTPAKNTLNPQPPRAPPPSQIEVVNLERVGLNLKNFDMAIVHKDFSKEVLRIDAIPAKRLDTVKDWLTSVNVKYYESRLNLAWKPILRSIQVRACVGALDRETDGEERGVFGGGAGGGGGGFSVLRSPFSVLRSPFSVLRSPFSVLRSPFSVLGRKKKEMLVF